MADIMPTLLALYDVPATAKLDGRSLLSGGSAAPAAAAAPGAAGVPGGR